MEFTGERFVPIQGLMNDEIAFEHLHRYYNALKLVKGKVVLDIACGEGYGTKILSKNASKVFGIDIDNASINHAKKTYPQNNIEFFCGGVQNIPLTDNSVDVVISFETIEHIDEATQNAFLKEIKRVLKKGGLLIISTPDKANYSDRYSYKNEFHIKEFGKDEFIVFLNNYFTQVSSFLQGYEIIDAITEQSPSAINELAVINWQGSPRPFARKYIIAICSDDNIETLHFSSAVFQVNKDYLDLMDGLVSKEAHILELGQWGRNLDKEIAEKNTYIGNLQQDLEKITQFSSSTELKNKGLEDEKIYHKEIIQKQLNIIQALSYIEKEKELLRQDLKQREASLVEKDSLIAKQNQITTALKAKIDESSQQIQNLEGINSDKETIILKQKEKEHSIYIQMDSLNRRLIEIYESDGWKLLNKYYNLKGRLLHEDSKRYKFLKKTINLLRGKKEAFPIAGVATNSGTNNLQHATSVNSEQQKVYDILSFEVFEKPTVTIIIPVYNGWDVTYRCLRSIYTNTIATSFEIIVADDGATDETKNISNYIKNITVIQNEKNLGFLHNCNNAAAKAKGKYILFLNNDTEVKPAWLTHLVDLMDKDDNIGMAGSKLIYPDGRLQEAGGILWKDGSAWNFGHGQSPDASQFNYVKEADYTSGACILIRSDLWKEIGGFDPRYAPAYCEDSDLAFEVRKRGYKVIYQPLSEVIHYEGYSHGVDGQAGTIKEYQKINNQKLKEKWHDVLQKEHFPNGENVFWARDRSRNKKTILVVDHYVPHYDKDAGSKTVFQYLQLFVSMKLNVKFIGDNFYRHEPYTTTLQQMGVEVLYGPWYAENWKQWIKDNDDKFDYVLLNRPHISVKYMDFIKENTNTKILYYGHDLHFMRMLKHYEVENKKEILEDAERWKKIETTLFQKANLILTPSEEEKDLIKKLGISTPVYAIKPYTFDFIPDPVLNFSNRNDILFVGGFSHIPNVDAVTWFTKAVWPQVRQKISGGKFIIVGSNVTPEISSLATEDINIVGFLSEPELQSLYKKIRLVVVPLRYGAGVKGKTVEAMYYGIPVVTTSFGIEGLPGAPSFIHSKNNADEFANEVVRLYNAPDQELVVMSNMETEYIHDHFHFDIVKKELLAIMDMPAIKDGDI